MYKKFLKITIIILLNLFAFLLFGSILGALFGNRGSFLVGAILASIIPLIIFLTIEIKKILKEINDINPKPKDYEGNSK